MYAYNVTKRVTDLIQDATGVRWPEEELVRWVSDGQREVVSLRPDAGARVGALPLVNSNTKQVIPSGGIRLLDVVRNLGADGATPGEVISIVDRNVLDAQRRLWHSEAGSATVKHFVFDGRAPTYFYVYPKPLAGAVVSGSSFVVGTSYTIVSMGTSTAANWVSIGSATGAVGSAFVATGTTLTGSGTATTGTQIEVVYSSSPADVTLQEVVASGLVAGATYTITSMGTSTVDNWKAAGANTGLVGDTFTATGAGTGTGKATTSGTLSVPDIYANALVDYVCYRAYSKDAEYAGNGGRSLAHYQSFIQSLSGGSAISSSTSPGSYAAGATQVSPNRKG